MRSCNILRVFWLLGLPSPARDARENPSLASSLRAFELGHPSSSFLLRVSSTHCSVRREASDVVELWFALPLTPPYVVVRVILRQTFLLKNVNYPPKTQAKTTVAGAALRCCWIPHTGRNNTIVLRRDEGFNQR